MPNNNWELELNEYIRQGEPDRVDKSNAWEIAIIILSVMMMDMAMTPKSALASLHHF